MFVFQRVMTMLFAAGVLAFLLPLAFKRHDYVIAGVACAIFAVYAITNGWLLWQTARRTRS